MENMDLINQPIEIKQEVEKHDEMDEIDNTAYMNSEKAYPYYGAQCDSIKIEEDTQNKQNGSDSDTLKREFIWMQANEQVFEAEIEKMKNENSIHHNVDPAQLAEESDSKVESGIIATSDSVQHRIKTELTGNYGGEDNSTTDAVDQVKIESQPVVEVKSEKLEEPYMDSMKFEDMDASQLNAELDIKCERDMSIMAGSSLDSAPNKKKCGKDLQVTHTEPERKLFICYNCNFTARSKMYLIQHIRVSKCKNTDFGKSEFCHKRQYLSNAYVCTLCKMVFKSKTSLDDHVVKNHIESIASVSSKIHECTQCIYKTTMKNCLTRHMLTHVGAASKSRICEHCDASFKSEKTLDNHIKKHRNFMELIKRKIAECTQCNYKTTITNSLTDHTLTHHSHSAVLKSSEHSLHNHVIKKHPEFKIKTKMYECSYCTFKTIIEKYFKEHMLVHSSDKLGT